MTALKPSGLSLLALAALFTVQPALAADYADLAGSPAGSGRPVRAKATQ